MIRTFLKNNVLTLKKKEMTRQIHVCLYRDFCQCEEHHHSKGPFSCRMSDLNFVERGLLFKLHSIQVTYNDCIGRI